MMDWFSTAKLLHVIYAIGVFVVGYFFAKKLSSFIEKPMINRFSTHHAHVTRRIVFYLVFSIFFMVGLQQLGLNLSVLLGAAGIFTVAIGFASQTAASNLISGIFLLFERPFKVRDSIVVKGITGVVESIDLLSTKIRTIDHTLVRVPNESLLRSDITNLSYFATRRLDVLINISYESNIAFAKSILLTLAKDCEGVLASSEPKVIIDNFGDYAVQLKLMVWVSNQAMQNVKNNLLESIKIEFDKQDIKIPVRQT